MLDNILNGLKGQMMSAITEKTGMNAQQAEQTVPMAKDSIMEGVMGAMTGGNMSEMMNMFSGGGNMMQNMVYQSIAKNFVNKMTAKLGVPSSMADTVSSMALPMIINKIKGNAADTDGNVNEGSLMSAMGMNSDSIMGKVGNMMGSGNMADNAMDAMKDKAGDMLKNGLGNMFGK